MNLFDLLLEEFEKELNKFLETKTPEQILADLIECGLELSDEVKSKMADFIYINAVEDLVKLAEALEEAAKKEQKKIKVDYKEITDPEEIKEMFDCDKE